MNLIKNFLHAKEIRKVGTLDEPWFVMKDVCKLLDIKDTRSGLKILKDEYKKEMMVTTSQKMSVINEPGFYMLIMRSNKPIVENFQKMICTEVLTHLRKTGQFKFKKEEKEENTSLSVLKKCGTCLIELPLKTRFYLRKDKPEKNNDDPSVYRSDCKACCLIKIQKLRKILKTDPMHNKKTCTSCNELCTLDLFFKKENDSLYDECIPCYTKKNSIEETTRQCINCKKLLAISEFHLHTKEFTRNICKSCRNRRIREKRYMDDVSIIKCEFCEKEIYSRYIKAHWKTKRCLQKARETR
jgi:prophage antirepressor-like protein